MGKQRLTTGEIASALEREGLLVYRSGGELPIREVSYDSRCIGEDSLFVCKGFGFRREYLDSAIKAGAVCYMAEEDYGAELPLIMVTDVRRALAVLSELLYGSPAEKLKIVGITGTKGKTTTTFFTKGILDAWLPYRSAVLSTVETYTGGEVLDSHLTTPESLELQASLDDAVAHGIGYMTMEVSSQAYKLDRVYGMIFDIGMFLNIAEDHIGPTEHDDMEDYLCCKLQLMKNCRTAIINSGTMYYDRVVAAAREGGARVITVGLDSANDYYIDNVVKQTPGFSFDICHAGGRIPCRITMEGRFNIQNALAAAAAARELGVDDGSIRRGLESVTVRGRMNVFEKDGVMVIVDYAHNHLSFEELYKSLREDYPGRRITTVVGCPGGHAFIRRRDIGTLCGMYADMVYLTEEDPQFEEVEDICADIAQYIQPYGKPYAIEPDRPAAVEKAIGAAKPGDIVILAAKGEEVYQKRRGEYVPVESDLAIARRMMQK